MTRDRIILWALPAGATDRIEERPLTSFLLTPEQADKVESVAARDGGHGFRRSVDDNRAPDFAACLNTGRGGQS